MPEKKYTTERIPNAAGGYDERRVDLRTGQTYFTSEEEDDADDRDTKKSRSEAAQKRKIPTASPTEI